MRCVWPLGKDKEDEDNESPNIPFCQFVRSCITLIVILKEWGKWRDKDFHMKRCDYDWFIIFDLIGRFIT